MFLFPFTLSVWVGTFVYGFVVTSLSRPYVKSRWDIAMHIVPIRYTSDFVIAFFVTNGILAMCFLV